MSLKIKRLLVIIFGLALLGCIGYFVFDFFTPAPLDPQTGAEEPVTPETPDAKPEEPGKPVEPVKPEEPVKPVEPVKPETPSIEPDPNEEPVITDPTERVPNDSNWQLFLVNSQNRLSLAYEPAVLQSVDGYYEMDSRVVVPMQNMIAAALQDGVNLRLCSAYRDADLQQYLYQQEIQTYLNQGYGYDAAVAEAGRWVAVPGTSEHQLGLSADIVSDDWLQAGNGLTASFETDPAFAWLAEQASTYGFILRYPEEKQDITKIGYEPWHYRYVGVEAAAVIRVNGFCLEEYLAAGE